MIVTSKKINPQIWQVMIGGKELNVEVDGQGEFGWKLMLQGEIDGWIETFHTKRDALEWVAQNPELCKLNGIKFK